MQNVNRVFQVIGSEDSEIVSRNLGCEIKPEYVRIAIEYCGICGTDHIFFSGKKKENYPICLGHEHCGTIIGVGKDVRTYKNGEFVAVDPNFRCGTCKYCKSSYGHMCEDYVSHLYSNKGFADFIDIHESYLVPLPAYRNRYIGALVEPLSVVLHSIEVSGISSKIKEKICIVGTGGIGTLLAFALLSEFSNIDVSLLDSMHEKTAKLKNIFGERVNILKDVNQGVGQFDYVFDAASSIQGFSDASTILAKLGTLIIISRYYAEEPKISNDNLIWKEATIKVSHLNGERKLMHDAARMLLEFWDERFDKLVYIYPFNEIQKAFGEFKKVSYNKKIVKMDYCALKG